MKPIKIKHTFMAALMLAALSASAQDVFVEATLDSSSLWIGNQTRLTLQVTQQTGQDVQLPYYDEKIIDGIEVIGTPAIDTTQANGNQIAVRMNYQITSFDDTLYVIPPFPVVVNGEDTVWSNSLALNVIQPFEIDSTGAITDIKAPMTAPDPWKSVGRLMVRRPSTLTAIFFGLAIKHIWLTICISLLMVLLPIGILHVIKRRRAIVTSTTDATPAEPLMPPYDEAIGQLDRIKNERKWEDTTKNKQYYSELTDVLRNYIDRIYGLSCMEMPTSDIMNGLRTRMLDKREAYQVIGRILSTADLVKFAKWQATVDENEDTLRNAYAFLNETKPEEPTEH